MSWATYPPSQTPPSSTGLLSCAANERHTVVYKLIAFFTSQQNHDSRKYSTERFQIRQYVPGKQQEINSQPSLRSSDGWESCVSIQGFTHDCDCEYTKHQERDSRCVKILFVWTRRLSLLAKDQRGVLETALLCSTRCYLGGRLLC